MRHIIRVLDIQDSTVFSITSPAGVAVDEYGFEIDPRKLTNFAGDKLLRLISDAAGLGVRFTYYEVDGGDIVRLVMIDLEDDATYRRLREVFSNDKWWEVCETVEEQLACNL